MDYTGDGKHNIDITENAKPFFGFEGRKIGINKTNTYKKEVKKVNRPFFEMEVVKAKKVKKEWTPECCPCCGAKSEVEKAIGNWVNGENLDEIKFPCFCRWSGGYGMIVTGYPINKREYLLVDIDEQTIDDVVVANRFDSLRELVEFNDIHILKGKIIIFEEEE